MSEPGAEIIATEWAWKTPAMRRMTLAICRLALERGVEGEFSALDLAEHGEAAHGGSGIAGSVFRLLAEHLVIAAVGTFVEGEFYQKRVRNTGGNPIGVWRLRYAGLAESLVRAHGGVVERQEQMELFAGERRTA